jgi:F-type H+-transporting ATPase subunit delta
MNQQTSPTSRNQAGHLFADVGALRVARVYAEALMRAAEKQGKVEEVWEQLDSLVQELFPARPELEQFLASGAVTREDKAKFLDKVFSGRASELFRNFLFVLNRHDRLDLVRAIHQAFRDLLDARARRVRVEVRTAVPLDDGLRNLLVEQIRDLLHLEPALEERVSPELLGGVVLRVGDQLFDGSVRSRLLKLREQLRERSSHEIQSRRDRFST